MEEQSKTDCITGIYLITHISTGRPYVGLTGQKEGFEKRWNGHRKVLRRGEHNPHLQNAWNKYGEEAFSFTVHTYIPQGNLTTEKFYMLLAQEEVRILKLFPDNFNGTNAGETGMTHKEEVRLRIRDANRIKMQNPEYRALKVSQINSAEATQKRAETMGCERIRRLKSVNSKRTSNDPVTKAKILAAIHNPEIQARSAAARKELWKNQEWRSFMKKKLRDSWSTPEVNEKKRIKMKAIWDDPVKRAERCEINKRAAATRKRNREAKLAAETGIEPVS